MRNLSFMVLVFLLSGLNCARPYHLRAPGVPVITGLEGFLSSPRGSYAGKKSVIVTNHSGVDRELVQNITLLRKKNINLVMIFAPEHGIYGHQNEYDKEHVITDRESGLPVYNMHQFDRAALKELMVSSGIEQVFFDIQDMGMRCYTYITNLKLVMDVLNGTSIKLVVLDRPNPIGFLDVDGAFLDPSFTSRFTAAFPAPFIYGMTMGEAARYYKGEFARQVDLEVIPLMNYTRDMPYSSTRFPWTVPSPNLPTYESSVAYSAVVLLEGVNMSLGRGSPKPFEYIGAPWIDPVAMSADLNRMLGKNFSFRPVYFTPSFSRYAGEVCAGVHLYYRGGKFSPTEFAYKVTRYLFERYPGRVSWKQFKGTYEVDYLAGTDRFRKMIDDKREWAEFREAIEPELRVYRSNARKYRLYP